MSTYRISDEGLDITVTVDPSFVPKPGISVEQMLGTKAYQKMCIEECRKLVENAIVEDLMENDYHYQPPENIVEDVLRIFGLEEYTVKVFRK